MDELISILLLIGVGIVSSRLKAKKAQQRSAQKSRGFDEAMESLAKGKRHVNRDILAQFMPELAEDDSSAKQPAKADPVRETPAMQAPAEAQIKPVIPMPKPVQKAAPLPVWQAAPLLFMDHDEPEGSVSTQGESAEEHARHHQKILAEEEKIRMAHEELQEIRNMNLQKLRTAVVMSEILDKPVSLRRRRTF